VAGAKDLGHDCHGEAISRLPDTVLAARSSASEDGSPPCAPAFFPSVEFNTAARDVILELRQRSEAQSAALQETIEQIGRLEAQVEALTTEIDVLRYKSGSTGSVPQRSQTQMHYSK
jgi:hypothetical protein